MSLTNDEIADVLDKARDVLIERGWHQGHLEGLDGSVCTLGAINAAVCGDALNESHALPYAVPLLKATHGPVFAWNDDPERTEDEVHDLLLNTAKELREKAQS